MNDETAPSAIAEEPFRQFAENTRDVLWITNLRDRRFEYLSPAFERIWGREREPIMADRGLWLQSVDPADRQKVRRACVRAQAGKEAMLDYRIHLPDGRVRWIRDDAFPIRNRSGGVERIGGLARDVTEHHESEQAKGEALAQRDLLLRELNHRVKNNLQLVTALLHLQAARLDDAGMRAQFEQASSRVAAIAEIHASLHPADGMVGDVAVGDYLKRLCGRLTTAFLEKGQEERISLTVEADQATLDLDRALPLGLIVNELVTNALKHAFPSGGSGAIRISFARRDGSWRLEVRDTGSGIPSFPEERESGFGSKLVRLLVKQIGGTLQVGRDAGTVAVVDVPG